MASREGMSGTTLVFLSYDIAWIGRCERNTASTVGAGGPLKGASLLARPGAGPAVQLGFASPTGRFWLWSRADSRNGFPYPEAVEVDKYYPQFYHKTDKDGRPVYIEQMGKLDINALYKITTQDRQLHHLVDEYEQFLGKRLPACSEKAGHLIETSCTILDLKNAGISTFYKGE